MEIGSAALRHGVAEFDIAHAIGHSEVVEKVGEDSSRFLALEPNRAGNLLKVVILDRETSPIVIHAMAMRTKRRSLLRRES